MHLTIPIVPTPKLTGIIARRGKHLTVEPTAKQKANETELIWMLKSLEDKPRKPLDGPLALGVWAYLPIPKSWTPWKKEAALAGILKPTPKPDMSNLTKQIEDCLTKAGIISDDSLIVTTLPGGKRYSETPRWEIEIVEEPWEPKTAAEYYLYKKEMQKMRDIQSGKIEVTL